MNVIRQNLYISSKVWNENIAPLLKEYIRAIESNENEIEKIIK
jgi:hypothetical protein